MTETLFEVWPDDYYDEIRRWTLTIRAVRTLKALRTCPHLSERKYWTYDELYETLNAWGYGCTRFGKHSLQTDLNNLWRCGEVSKFIKGYYIRSERPYGIHWYIHGD